MAALRPPPRPALFLLLLLGTLALPTGPSLAGEWSLSFGHGKGQVGFLNATVQKTFQEAAALGPLAFRVWRDQAWILDSLGGRILCLDASGKLVAALALEGLPPNSLLEDLALVPGPDGRVESVWVGDGADGSLRRVRIADGRVLTRAGGQGDGPGTFRQIHQLECGPDGRLYVGDLGRGVIAAFDPAGRLDREWPWSRSGFAVDTAGMLSTIDYTETVGHVWRTYDPQGGLRKSVHLGWSDFQNPRLWAVTRGGGIVVSFVPPGGFRGQLRLVAFDAFGKSLGSHQFAPPQAMNRFLDFGGVPETGAGAAFWLARGDFDRAPAGPFAVVRSPWEETR